MVTFLMRFEVPCKHVNKTEDDRNQGSVMNIVRNRVHRHLHENLAQISFVTAGVDRCGDEVGSPCARIRVLDSGAGEDVDLFT